MKLSHFTDGKKVILLFPYIRMTDRHHMYEHMNICSTSIIINISVSCLVVSDSLRLHGLQPTRLLCPWDSPGKNAGVGCHSLLQGIFSTQRLNPGHLHCRQILYRLSHPINGKIQIKITARYYLTPVRMAIIKKTEKHNKCCQGYREKGTLVHCG